MAVMTYDACQSHLMPLADVAIPTLHESHQLLQQILDDRPQLHSVLDSSTQASMLSNIFCDLIMPKFARLGVTWQKSGRMQFGIVGDVINLRFKKLTTDLHSMNIPTEQQIRLYHQWTLPNFQELTQITFGYINNPIARQITGMFFVCPSGFRSNHWACSLYGGSDGISLFSGSPPEPTVYDPDLDVTVSANRSAAENA